ncbi:MAG: hypothetical protein JKY44_04205 [Flavobacteriaceae bacterium]|nr:hypothetical protein [Flavobacteriaceae bacterium]
MQLKHLFVFLLVLVITVAESNAYSQENISRYYQSSKVVHKKKFSYANTKLVVFNQNIRSGTCFSAFFFPCINLKSAFQKQIQRTLKLQKQRYQKISLLKIKHIFLLKKYTSSNSVTNIYIA